MDRPRPTPTTVRLFALFSVMLWIPEASGRINLRGLRGDLASEADRFVPLDLNGDRKTDLLYYRPGQGFAAAYLSYGDGTFRYVPYSSPGSQSNGFAGDVSSAKDTAVPLDFNGDGKDDFLWYRPGSGWASVCISRGTGELNCEELSRPGLQSKGFTGNMSDERDTLVALDLTGDGRSDIILLRPGTGWASAYISQPDGSLKPVVYSQPNQQSNGFEDWVTDGRERVLPLDLNGDKRSDFLFYAPGSGFMRAYISRGDGTLQALVYSRSGQKAYGFGGDVNDSRGAAVPLDLNGDGKDDFLWYVPGGGEAIAHLSNGDGTVRAIRYRPGGQSGFAGDVMSTSDRALPLDVNGDGKDDFLWYRPGSQYASVYLSNGDGTLTFVGLSEPGRRYNGFSWDVADSRDTALAANLKGGSASGFIFLRPGGSEFAAFLPDPAGTGPKQVSLQGFAYFGDTATWMGDLSYLIDKTPLKGIVMPGTHDAAMYKGMADIDLNKCQQSDFYGQMKAGARWFDLRFAHISSTTTPTRYGLFPDNSLAKAVAGSYVSSAPEGLIFYGHSDQIVEVTVAEGLRQIRRFLDEHPREIAILSLRGYVSGTLGDWTNDTAAVLRTELGNLIYDKKDACNLGGGFWSSAGCASLGGGTIPQPVLPQDVTPESLRRIGKRVFLLDAIDSNLVQTTEVWPGRDHLDGAGYKSDNGIAHAETQVKYMTSAIVNNRPAFATADDATKLLQLNAALTPWGDAPCDSVVGGVLTCVVSRVIPPMLLSRAMNPQLTDVLRSDQWKRYALNIISIDNIDEGDIAEAIIEFNDQRWLRNPVKATDVGAGADGSVWILDSDKAIYQGVGDGWRRVPGAAVRIAVDPRGLPWVVNENGQIFRFRGSDQWELMPGAATDIGIGADGSVWVTGRDSINSEGSAIFKWTGSSWSRSPGDAAATRIAVDPSGNPWVVNASGRIFRYNPRTPEIWDTIPLPSTRDDLGGIILSHIGYTASDIGVGPDGSVWFAGGGTAGTTWRFNGGSWQPIRIGAENIAVSAAGQPWVTTPVTKQLYTGTVQ